MSIDKNWTKPALNRNSLEFKHGLNDFYERCKAHINDRVSFIPTSRVNDDDFIDDDVELLGLRVCNSDHIGWFKTLFVQTMAMVVREDGPPDDDTWEPRPIKKNAKGRKKGSDAGLIKKFEDGEKKKLPIKFDLNDLRTAKPIGLNR
ncbi:hypothetical protein Tco_0069160 [Tanacetum coccineum]